MIRSYCSKSVLALCILPIFLTLLSCVSFDPITYVPPKSTCVTVLSGSVNMHIHGQITTETTDSITPAAGDRNLFADSEVEWTLPVGTETLNKEVTMVKDDYFQYVLAAGESVAYIMTAQTEEAIVEVIDGSSRKEYTIERRRPIGLMAICAN